MATATRGARQEAIHALVASVDPGDRPHALFNGRALSRGGTGGKGVCRLCRSNHASWCARRALKVSVRKSQRFSGCAAQGSMAGSGSTAVLLPTI